MLNASQMDSRKFKQASMKYEGDIRKFLAKGFAVVHFWKPKVLICCSFRFARFQVGHLSLTLPDETHISLWPAGKKELKEDIELEQRVPDEFILVPTDKVQEEELLKFNFNTLRSCNFLKHCLLPSRVKLWWEKCANDKYNILRNNCAHTVYKALLEGDFETEKVNWVPVLTEIRTFFKYCEVSCDDMSAEQVMNFAAILVENSELMTVIPHFESISAVESHDASVFIEVFKIVTRHMQQASLQERRQFNDDVLKAVAASCMVSNLPFRHICLGLDVIPPINFCFSLLSNNIFLDGFAKSEMLPLSIDAFLKVTHDKHQGEFMSAVRAAFGRIKNFSVQERKALLIEVRNFLRACNPTTSASLMPVPSLVFNHVTKRLEDVK